jgi:hypothetical protein
MIKSFVENFVKSYNSISDNGISYLGQALKNKIGMTSLNLILMYFLMKV